PGSRVRDGELSGGALDRPPLGARGAQLGPEHVGQRGQVVGPTMAATVDEEGRGADRAAVDGAGDVTLDAQGVPPLAQVARETFDVETEIARVVGEVRLVESRLVGEEQVVHLPEATLGGSGLGRLRR